MPPAVPKVDELPTGAERAAVIVAEVHGNPVRIGADADRPIAIGRVAITELPVAALTPVLPEAKATA